VRLFLTTFHPPCTSLALLTIFHTVCSPFEYLLCSSMINDQAGRVQFITPPTTGKRAISIAFIRSSVHLSVGRVIPERKSIACPNLEGRFPILDATPISVSRSNGHRSGLEAVGGIPCRPNPAPTLLFRRTFQILLLSCIMFVLSLISDLIFVTYSQQSPKPSVFTRAYIPSFPYLLSTSMILHFYPSRYRYTCV